jgi:hypothetical protein
MKMTAEVRLFALGTVLAVPGLLSAAPVAGSIDPIAVYRDTAGSFGLTYDPVRDVMWYDSLGGSTAWSIKPFKDFTAAEIAAMPVVDGLPVVDNATANHAAFTTPLPVGGEAMAFDTASGKLVMNSRGAGKTISFDPVTGANVADFGFGEGILTDGLDVTAGTEWHSRDGFFGVIHKSGAVFAEESVAAQTVLPGWSGAGPGTTDFWSGVQQIGDSLYAVAVQTNEDIANSRTIVRFNAATGELLAYDPDGYLHARRWEDLGYDGRYLYAADLRGNEFGGTNSGQIFVFDLGGGLKPNPPGVPDGGSSLLLFGMALAGVGALRRNKA